MLCHATGNSETHFPIVYRYNLLMYFIAHSVCPLRPILNLAWNSITNGVYVLANYSECCVMLSRAHYLAIYENPIEYL